MADRERIIQWIAALLSGEFKQGRSRLQTLAGYCCLGVACEVAVRNGLDITPVESEGGGVDYDGQVSYLPQSVVDWYGFDGPTGLIVGDGTGVDSELNYDLAVAGIDLTDWNDDRRSSFSEIAGLLMGHFHITRTEVEQAMASKHSTNKFKEWARKLEDAPIAAPYLPPATGGSLETRDLREGGSNADA